MDQKKYSITDTVKIFDTIANPWIYLPVPKKYFEELRKYMIGNLIPITATLGKTTWDTCLAPKGDGTQFIPLKIKVRKDENIKVGDKIKLSFTLRPV